MIYTVVVSHWAQVLACTRHNKQWCKVPGAKSLRLIGEENQRKQKTYQNHLKCSELTILISKQKQHIVTPSLLPIVTAVHGHPIHLFILPVHGPNHSGSAECVPEAEKSSTGVWKTIIRLRREAVPFLCFFSAACLCVTSHKERSNKKITKMNNCSHKCFMKRIP